MEIKDIYGKLEDSITKMSDVPVDDRGELEKVMEFGVAAIGTLEALVDTVLAPIIKAKKELFKSRDAEKVQDALIEITTEIYDELDDAQDMVFKFTALNSSFNDEIVPILAKYFGREEIDNWREIFNLTQNTRSMSYARVESLLPKIEGFLEARYYSSGSVNPEVSFKDLKDYLNEIIGDMRSTKKELQRVKANFIRLSGVKGLTNITQKKISGENKIGALEKALDKIENLVANGRTETALENMADLCNFNYPEILKDIIMLQSRHSAANRNLSQGKSGQEITINQVNLGLLRLVEEIRKREMRS